jgi:hypothetical protein
MARMVRPFTAQTDFPGSFVFLKVSISHGIHCAMRIQFTNIPGPVVFLIARMVRPFTVQTDVPGSVIFRKVKNSARFLRDEQRTKQ